MYRVVNIGAKEVPMLAVASVDDYYKTLFRDDPLNVLTSKSSGDGDKTRLAFGMGFIMAKKAEMLPRNKMKSLTYDEYLDWLDQFAYGDFLAAVPEILKVYTEQKKPTVPEKN